MQANTLTFKAKFVYSIIDLSSQINSGMTIKAGSCREDFAVHFPSTKEDNKIISRANR